MNELLLVLVVSPEPAALQDIEQGETGNVLPPLWIPTFMALAQQVAWDCRVVMMNVMVANTHLLPLQKEGKVHKRRPLECGIGKVPVLSSYRVSSVFEDVLAMKESKGQEMAHGSARQNVLDHLRIPVTDRVNGIKVQHNAQIGDHVANTRVPAILVHIQRKAKANEHFVRAGDDKVDKRMAEELVGYTQNARFELFNFPLGQKDGQIPRKSLIHVPMMGVMEAMIVPPGHGDKDQRPRNARQQLVESLAGRKTVVSRVMKDDKQTVGGRQIEEHKNETGHVIVRAKEHHAIDHSREELPQAS